MQITFSATTLPRTVAEFKAMPEFGFSTPEQTAALFIVAMAMYPHDPEVCFEMINALKGPEQLRPAEKTFIRERLRNKAEFAGNAYFVGATPANDYTPEKPYRVVFVENPHSYADKGYASIYIHTNGADNPRLIKLRQKGNEWFIWEFYGPMTDLKLMKSQDPWA